MEVFGSIWVLNGTEFSNENNQKKLFLNISLYTWMASISASATKKRTSIVKLRTTVASQEHVLQYMIKLNW